MRNIETGEFELVVGNRQLLSGFFIVVLLFAVSFAMGYVVGQNSPRPAKAQEAAAVPVPSAAAADARPAPAPPAAPPQTEAAAQPADAPAGAQDSEAAPQPSTQPVRDNAAAPVTQAPAAAPAAELAPGAYWQVMALPQPEAETVLRTLKDKGFPAFLLPGPNNLIKVLVGPYGDTQAMGKAKTDLGNAGFAHPWVFRK